MQIRWLNEPDISTIARWGEAEGWLIDEGELSRIRSRFFYLCFGAFEDDCLLGAIMGYAHEKTAWICDFLVDKARRRAGVGTRLFEHALDSIAAQKPTQRLFAEPNMAAFYERYGFKAEGLCGRFVLRGGAKTPPLSADRLRKMETKDANLLLKYATAAFGEDRSAFINEDMTFASSLILALPNGALHSRMIGKSVFAGPFLAREAAYNDAETLLRALVAIRGQKPIAVDLPMENSEATRILNIYGFKQTGETIRMSRGKNIRERAAMIYGYATAGSHG
ncbi:MAG: GNAT family N-acetyltransferase [Helicobacteraceae bacterium]|nr:GNAT family N-acetyltransferase [Helicobacteraceae bacterium]